MASGGQSRDIYTVAYLICVRDCAALLFFPSPREIQNQVVRSLLLDISCDCACAVVSLPSVSPQKYMASGIDIDSNGSLTVEHA